MSSISWRVIRKRLFSTRSDAWAEANTDVRYWRFVGYLPLERSAVLDIGCGSGVMIEYLSRHRRVRLIGLDIRASTRWKEIEASDSDVAFVAADMVHLPFSNESASAVLSYGTFHHADFRILLREIERVLRPGGVLAFVDFVRHSNSLVSVLAGTLAATCRQLVRWRSASVTDRIGIFLFRLNPIWLAHLLLEKQLSFDRMNELTAELLPGRSIERIGGSAVFVTWKKP